MEGNVMQVVCGNCQLSFQAPDGATGLVCPICRSPLRATDAAAEPEGEVPRQVVEWSGGTLDDLVALLSAPAWSARVEVLPRGDGNALGEVHVIAGGVSEAIHDGKSTHDALDKLRAIKNTRFRIEARLPNPSDGDLTFPGPDHGKLEERPLATLMRYCEDYVLTSGIEVWRANENAKVEYRRGEIVGVTVGGIDAPERLAEVMKWSSGSYRLSVPKLTLPETAPKAAVPAAIVASRGSGAASKTIFGMPALDPAAIAAATDKAKAVQAQAPNKAAAVAPSSPRASSPGMPAAPPRAAGTTIPPGVVPATTPAVVSAPATAAAPLKQATASGQPAPVAHSAPPAAAPPAQESRTGAAAKTIFGVQAPAVAPVAAAPSATPAPRAEPPTAQPSADPRAGRPTVPLAQQPAAVAKSQRSTPAPTATGRAQPPASATPAGAVSDGDHTIPTKAPKQKPSETPVWTYVGVGFIFGLALLGVYRLVLVLAH